LKNRLKGSSGFEVIGRKSGCKVNLGWNDRDLELKSIFKSNLGVEK
jgi:hypothetical protein